MELLTSTDKVELGTGTFEYGASCLRTPSRERGVARPTRAIQAVLRPCDLLARWGGEEFLVAIVNIPPDRLVIVAEAIRAGISAGVRFSNEAVAASVGVAVGPSDQFLSFVGRADAALYEAKAAGRNRVAVAK